MAVGAIIGGACVFWRSRREVELFSTGKWVAEQRLPLAMVGAVMLPVSMFWMSWSGQYPSVHWIVPTLAGVPLCIAIVLIFASFMNYLTDTYLMYAASAVAANTVCRSALATASPVFTSQMFHTLGVGGAGSLLAGIACVCAPIPFVFYRYGERLRKASKYTPTAPSTAKVESEEDSVEA